LSISEHDTEVQHRVGIRACLESLQELESVSQKLIEMKGCFTSRKSMGLLLAILGNEIDIAHDQLQKLEEVM
jgi:hypothetical protein